jgi:6-pyruvoyltetrahydropterin/6-carboxytetrahydropterin synthase
MELVIDGWAVGARFSSCHIIPGHPKCGRLHGHSYAASAKFRGEAAGPNGMLVDFHDAKRAMREVCEALDHRVLIPMEREDVTVLVVGDNLDIRVQDKAYSLPKDDVLLMPLPAVTAERLSEWFLGELLRRLPLPPNVTSASVGIEEGQGQGAWATLELGGGRAIRAIAGPARAARRSKRGNARKVR